MSQISISSHYIKLWVSSILKTAYNSWVICSIYVMSPCPTQMPVESLKIFVPRQKAIEKSAILRQPTRMIQTNHKPVTFLIAPHGGQLASMWTILFWALLQVSPCRRAWKPAYLNHQISLHSSPSARFALARQTNQSHAQPVWFLIMTQVLATQKGTTEWHEETAFSSDCPWLSRSNDFKRKGRRILWRAFAHEQ